MKQVTFYEILADGTDVLLPIIQTCGAQSIRLPVPASLLNAPALRDLALRGLAAHFRETSLLPRTTHIVAFATESVAMGGVNKGKLMLSAAAMGYGGDENGLRNLGIHYARTLGTF